MTGRATPYRVCSARVELPYAVFRVDYQYGTVVDAAPIARWMIGKPYPMVLGWVKRKGGTVQEMAV